MPTRSFRFQYVIRCGDAFLACRIEIGQQHFEDLDVILRIERIESCDRFIFTGFHLRSPVFWVLFLSFLCEGDTFYEQKTAGYVQRDGHRRLKTQKRCPRLLVGNADWRAVLATAAAAVIAKAVSAAAEGQQDQDPDDRTAVIAAVASAVSDPIAVAEAAAEEEQEQDQTAVVAAEKSVSAPVIVGCAASAVCC